MSALGIGVCLARRCGEAVALFPVSAQEVGFGLALALPVGDWILARGICGSGHEQIVIQQRKGADR